MAKSTPSERGSAALSNSLTKREYTRPKAMLVTIRIAGLKAHAFGERGCNTKTNPLTNREFSTRIPDKYVFLFPLKGQTNGISYPSLFYIKLCLYVTCPEIILIYFANFQKYLKKIFIPHNYLPELMIPPLATFNPNSICRQSNPS